MKARFTKEEADKLVMGVLGWLSAEVPDIQRGEAIAVLGATLTSLIETYEDEERRDRMRRRVKLAIDLSAGAQWPKEARQ